jgi:hypothetical protein
MATPKKKPKIVQVCMTHDGRIASLLYDDGRVFLYTYTREPVGKIPGEGFWAELTYPDTKVEKQTTK